MNTSIEYKKSPSWIEESVVYQIFPDRFRRSRKLKAKNNFMNITEEPNFNGFFGGDLYGIIDSLEYLKNMGITCISLNPIFSSAANHRYHTYDYFQVDPLLGGNEAFDLLLEEIHQRNMHLVLDGVFNHSGRGFYAFHHIVENGTKSPYKDWFKIYKDKINPYPNNEEKCGYECWWNDPALPKFNFSNREVQNYLLSVASYWAKRGIDGWRLDVAKEIPFSFWDKFNTEMKRINPEIWVLGEIWGDARKWMNKNYFDGIMNYRIGWSTISWVSDKKLNSTYKNALYPIKNLNSKEYIDTINKTFSWYTNDANKSNLNLLDSHDVPRALNTLKDFKCLKLALFLLFLYKGVPSIYYGTEVGLSGGGDPLCREPFPWGIKPKVDLRPFIKELINFRKKNYSLIKNGIILNYIEEDVLVVNFKEQNSEIEKKSSLKTIYVNRSKKNYFRIPKSYSKVTYFSEETNKKIMDLPPQAFVCLES